MLFLTLHQCLSFQSILHPPPFFPLICPPPHPPFSLPVSDADVLSRICPPTPPPPVLLLCLRLTPLPPLLACLSPPSRLLVLPPPVFSSLRPVSVCDSQERGEECGEHVRSPEIPLGSGEQRGVVVLLRGAESLRQRPVPVPHLPRRPGHPGLSWPGAEQSG